MNTWDFKTASSL